MIMTVLTGKKQLQKRKGFRYCLLVCVLFAILLSGCGNVADASGSDVRLGADQFAGASQQDYSRYEGKDEIPILEPVEHARKGNADGAGGETSTENLASEKEDAEETAQNTEKKDAKHQAEAPEQETKQPEAAPADSSERDTADTTENVAPADTSNEQASSSEDTQSKPKDETSKEDKKQEASQEETSAETGNTQLTCTLYIECGTILNHMDNLTAGKEGLVPGNGVIYGKRQVTFSQGETVFDVLLRETKNNRIQMEYSYTPAYGSNYIEGIHNLYEFDCGELSGWMYSVNGVFPNYGCSQYTLSDGDAIAFRYTCDLGRDL